MEIDNPFDATLIQILSALCTRRDIPHVSEDLAQTPFDHVLGTLARSTIANAIKKDGRKMRQFQISDALLKRFSEFKLVEDHVFPLHQWKSLLLILAREQGWQVDQNGLQGLRDFFAMHYVTALIPEALHLTLSRYEMPKGWQYSGFESLWDRYRTDKVRNFIGRELVLPTDEDGSVDFVLIST
jgi:hypothetical protein